MTIETLEEFRKDFAGCEIVVFADISSRTVLAWDGALKWPQEDLDDLCEQAACILSVGAEIELFEEPQSAILARATGCFVFIRAAPNANEILCSVFAPDSNFDKAFAAGKALCKCLLDTDQQMRS